MIMTTEHNARDSKDGLPVADDLLMQIFAEARAAEPPVPEALMARVLADAVAEAPAPCAAPVTAPRMAPQTTQAVAPPRPAPSRPIAGWFDRLSAYLGGRGALAGMAAAGLAGVWIGFAQPVALPFDVLAFDALSDTGTVDLFPADLDTWTAILTADVSEG